MTWIVGVYVHVCIACVCVFNLYSSWYLLSSFNQMGLCLFFLTVFKSLIYSFMHLLPYILFIFFSSAFKNQMMKLLALSLCINFIHLYLYSFLLHSGKILPFKFQLINHCFAKFIFLCRSFTEFLQQFNFQYLWLLIDYFT